MQTKTLIIASGFVAGIPHRNPDLSVVSSGDVLVLQSEPENPHESSAIKILHKNSGQFLGYVPREQTAAIHHAQAEGFEVFARMTALQPHVKWKELGFGCSVSFILS